MSGTPASWWRRTTRPVANSLLVGLVLVTPIAFTALIVQYLFRLLISNQLTRFLAGLLMELVPGAGNELHRGLVVTVAVLLIFASLFLVGLVVRSLVGRRLYALGDRVMTRIPLINRIYVFIRQVSEAIFTQRNRLFREAVLVEYPRKGVYALAFVTAPMPPHMRDRMDVAPGKELVTLFLPTTPNPTSGFLLILPREETVPFPASSAEAMNFILSAGNLYPGAKLAPTRLSLLDMMERWGRDGRDRPDPAAPGGTAQAPPPAG